jgi:hypothetical protein
MRVLVNPADSGGAVNYTLNGNPFTIEPGSRKVLPDKRGWRIEFDRGDNNGAARYSLPYGTYTFAVTSKGWELYDTVFWAKLDNSANPADFNYQVIGDRVETAPAGQTRYIRRNFPIVIQFDRGDGGALVTKTLQADQTYRIGWDPEAKALDLIATEAPATLYDKLIIRNDKWVLPGEMPR